MQTLLRRETQGRNVVCIKNQQSPTGQGPETRYFAPAPIEAHPRRRSVSGGFIPPLTELKDTVLALRGYKRVAPRELGLAAKAAESELTLDCDAPRSRLPKNTFSTRSPSGTFCHL